MTIESKMFLGPLVVPLKLFGSFKNLKKVIITTSKLVVCPAPRRGYYRHNPCKGHRVLLSHHTHCHP